MSPVRPHAAGVEIDLLVVPRSARERIGPTVGDRLKVAVQAPPVDGAANQAVTALLARTLGVPRSAVEVVRGESGRRKTVRIAGVSVGVVESAMAAEIQA